MVALAGNWVGRWAGLAVRGPRGSSPERQPTSAGSTTVSVASGVPGSLRGGTRLEGRVRVAAWPRSAGRVECAGVARRPSRRHPERRPWSRAFPGGSFGAPASGAVPRGRAAGVAGRRTRPTSVARAAGPPPCGQPGCTYWTAPATHTGMATYAFTVAPAGRARRAPTGARAGAAEEPGRAVAPSTRLHERQMQGFRSVRSARRFLAASGRSCKHFRVRRHLTAPTAGLPSPLGPSSRSHRPAWAPRRSSDPP